MNIILTSNKHVMPDGVRMVDNSQLSSQGFAWVMNPVESCVTCIAFGKNHQCRSYAEGETENVLKHIIDHVHDIGGSEKCRLRVSRLLGVPSSRLWRDQG